MTDHTFGGNWTEVKLTALRNYLGAYRQIFSKNPSARRLKTWYVDAYAGTGSRRPAPLDGLTLPLFETVAYRDQDAEGYFDGSARIALGLPSPFDRYLFIEKSKRRIHTLQQMVQADFASLEPRCCFETQDSNEALRSWCASRDWKKERAVVFLDPYGMQVDWSTVQALASTQAVDLWYLFPLGVGVARLLRRDGNLPETWQRSLDRLFGTRDWQERFFRLEESRGLFDSLLEQRRDASAEKIQAYVEERLRGIFAGVAKGMVLYNSKESPLYLLCFAAANKRGADVAIKIAGDILGY
jgi:three-Cys-motif partner protein